MPLDLTLLTSWHLLLFGVSFAAVFSLFALLLKGRSGVLRRHQPSGVFYGGVILLGVADLLIYFLLEDVRLRVGLLAASFLILVIGIIDEQVRLSPGKQLLWQVVIALVAASWGWSIQEISNPWSGGVINLEWFTLSFLIFPGSFLSILWIVFLMNAVNWLDGVDGLAGGVTFVGLLTLAAVSLLPSIQDAESLRIALVGAGCILGFLLWNFAPAKVYLGTTGSWFLGLLIGFTAMLGGGKIVTTLLVLALPVIDVGLVLLSRLFAGRKPWQGDRVHHVHHRLLALRFSPRTIALLGIVVTSCLGVAAINLQTQQKIVAFITAAVVLVAVLLGMVYKQTRTT